MFGRKQVIIEPIPMENDALIQKSDVVSIDKHTMVTVPSSYKAIAIIDEKPSFRIEPCVKKKIVENYGKEYMGKQLQIAFILPKSIAQSAWGFGNIQVNNARLKEAYRIGANGKFTVEITDYAQTIKSFPISNIITMEQIREKTISTIKTVGTPKLAEYFSNTSTSVFEISSVQLEFRDNLFDALQNESIFKTMGLKISSLTVDGFYVNEDDLDMIRERLNS